MVRNAAIGRSLGRLLHNAGFIVESVNATVALFRDYRSAETILRMPTVAERARQIGHLDEDKARAWLAELAAGPFLAVPGSNRRRSNAIRSAGSGSPKSEYAQRRAARLLPTAGLLTREGEWLDPDQVLHGASAAQKMLNDFRDRLAYFARADAYLRGLLPDCFVVRVRVRT